MSQLASYEIWWLLNWDSFEESPQELQAGFIWNWIVFQVRVNYRTTSKAPGWIHMTVQLRINCRMASKDTGWIHMKCGYFSLKNQLKDCVKSSRLDSYEVWSLFSCESINEWPPELQAGLIWNFIILNWESINEWPRELQAGFIWIFIIFELTIS